MPSETDNHTRLRAILCVLIAAAIAVVYAGVRDAEFVWDDGEYVVRNEALHAGFGPEGLRFAFLSAGYAMNWHPLTWLSHMLDFQLYGLDPTGHHLTNVVLHGVNSLLLLLLLERWTRRILPSAFAAALFALHPIHVESVAWVAERKDVLSMLCGLCTLWCYTTYAERPRIDSYALVAVLLSLALMAKPTMVTLPALLLVLDCWPLRRSAPWRVRVLEKVPLFMLSAVCIGMTIAAQSAGGAVVSTELVGWSDRLTNAIVSYARYLGHLVWPVNLAALYPHPALPGGAPLRAAEVLTAGAVLIGITSGAVLLRKRRPYLLVGWLWFLGTSVPVIGLVQVGWQAMADRYAYIMFPGLYLAVALGAGDLLRGVADVRARTVIGGVFALLALSSFGCCTVLQARSWHDPIALFSRSIEKTAGSPKAHYNLGCALQDAGRRAEAIEQYRIAIAERPRYADPHANLGAALAADGQLDAAIAEFTEALRCDPTLVSARTNLASALLLRGKTAEAIQQLTELVRRQPKSVDALTRLAWALATRADVVAADAAADAVAFAERAVMLSRRGDARALDALAAGLARRAEFRRAAEIAAEALARARQAGGVGVGAIERRRQLYLRGECYLEPPAGG